MFVGSADDIQFGQKSQYLNTSEDALLSLLRPSVPSSDLQALRSVCPQERPPSFSEPFDNPDLEPLPIGPPGSHRCLPTPLKLQDSIPTPLKLQDSIKPDLGQSIFNLLDDSAPVGYGRTFDDIFSPGTTPFRSQCQSTTPNASSEETVMRFRPYQEKLWGKMYEKLVEYQHKHGHCCVPHSYKENPMLARWVKRQRYQRKKLEDNDPTSTMTAHRVQQLEAIGFVWQSHASAWQTKLNELKAFKHRMGHCNVPSTYAENVPLSTWVRSQRRQYQLWKSGCQSTMTIQRCEQLESLGFCFEKPNSKKEDTV